MIFKIALSAFSIFKKIKNWTDPATSNFKKKMFTFYSLLSCCSIIVGSWCHPPLSCNLAKNCSWNLSRLTGFVILNFSFLISDWESPTSNPFTKNFTLIRKLFFRLCAKGCRAFINTHGKKKNLNTKIKKCLLLKLLFETIFNFSKSSRRVVWPRLGCPH